MQTGPINNVLLFLLIFLTSLIASAESFVEFIISDKTWPERKWGHVSLRVKDTSQDLIFDFGRYGKMWGFFNTEGEPILRVWKNSSAKHLNYLKDGNPRVYAIRFPATAQEIEGVLNFYENLLHGQKSYKKKATIEYYDLKRPAFHSINHNCTTMAISAFMSGYPNYEMDKSSYAKGKDLYWWARRQATSVSYNSHRKHWEHIWWPEDLIAILQNEFVKKGFATEKNY